MTDRRWPAGARAPRRALDALDALAAASSPLRNGRDLLVELTGDPLRSLTAAAELPRPLEAALARLEQPPGEAAQRVATHGPRLPARPRPGPRPARGIERAAQLPDGGERPAGEPRARMVDAKQGVAVADPDAVRRAVTSALAQLAPEMRAGPTRSPRARGQGPFASPPASAAVRAPLPAGDGMAGFAARIAGGEAAMTQPLVLGSPGADEAGAARSSETRTDRPVGPGGPAAGSPASPAGVPTMPALPRSATGPEPAPALAAAAAPAAPPRNLAELVEHWSRRGAATIAPSADLIPVAGGPAPRGSLAAAAPPVGTVIARVADEPPRSGELIALDALTHAIERVLVAEVRRHGLVVEES